MKNLDFLIIESQENSELLERIIQQNESYILKCTYEVTHKYITKSDDEWSIALLAFVESTRSYDLSKGRFLNFSKLVMTRRLIDYIRSQNKHRNEIIVNPIVFDTETTENDYENTIHLELVEKISQRDTDSLRLEITTVNTIFLDYGFSFYDLANCSPHAKKTRTACAKAINFILSQSLILHELRATKHLPIKLIQKNTNLPPKLLDKHRKYIIAAVEILSGEYPLLSEYLRFISEEM